MPTDFSGSFCIGISYSPLKTAKVCMLLDYVRIRPCRAKASASLALHLHARNQRTCWPLTHLASAAKRNRSRSRSQHFVAQQSRRHCGRHWSPFSGHPDILPPSHEYGLAGSLAESERRPARRSGRAARVEVISISVCLRRMSRLRSKLELSNKADHGGRGRTNKFRKQLQSELSTLAYGI